MSSPLKSALSGPLKKRLSKLVLRGPLLDLWCDRKYRILEGKLCAETVRTSEAAPLPLRPPGRKLAVSPRKIVFIGDILWERDGLIPELEKICPVEVLDLRPHLKKEPEAPDSEVAVRAIRDFLNAPREQEPDVILFYARAGLLSEEAFSLLRSKWSCPLLGWNLDDKMTFWNYGVFSDGNDGYLRWAPFFDLNITNSKIGFDWYRQQGVPVIYAPQGVSHPAGLTEPQSAAFDYPVSFLGVKKLDRAVVVNQLLEKGIPVTVFGAGWPQSRWVDDSTTVFRGSQINLGIGTATSNYTTTKGRDFECPGVGACYMTTYNWELAQWWDIGKEILCYRNIEEAVEIISFYRNRPEECLRIAQAAFRRAVHEHTWEKRFRAIFAELS